MSALQDFFIHIERTQYWFYGLLFYSDLGSKKSCETYPGEHGGSYVQFGINITHFPMNVPISVCLPAECANQSLYLNTTKKIQAMTNELLIEFKKKVDLDDLHNKIEPEFEDGPLLKQILALVTNDTFITLRAHVPTTNTEDLQSETESIYIPITWFVGLLIVLFFVLPNLTYLYLHIINKRARLPETIANIL